MPICADCGTETPREQMYGYADELRCRACVQKLRQPDETPPRRPADLAFPPVTLAALAAAVAATALFMKEAPVAGKLVVHGPALWDGEAWRLLTSAFPHVNLLHLAFNCYWLWRWGRVLEAWMGSLRFAGLVVFLAVGSSAAQFLVSSPGGGVGLSGVGYGLFGFLFALRAREEFAREQTDSSVVKLFVGWFFVCLALTCSFRDFL